MPKAMQLGWILPFSPSPYENGVWKRLYIENINALKCFTPKVCEHPPLPSVDTTVPTVARLRQREGGILNSSLNENEWLYLKKTQEKLLKI